MAPVRGGLWGLAPASTCLPGCAVRAWTARTPCDAWARSQAPQATAQRPCEPHVKRSRSMNAREPLCRHMRSIVGGTPRLDHSAAMCPMSAVRSSALTSAARNAATWNARSRRYATLLLESHASQWIALWRCSPQAQGETNWTRSWLTLCSNRTSGQEGSNVAAFAVRTKQTKTDTCVTPTRHYSLKTLFIGCEAGSAWKAGTENKASGVVFLSHEERNPTSWEMQSSSTAAPLAECDAQYD